MTVGAWQPCTTGETGFPRAARKGYSHRLVNEGPSLSRRADPEKDALDATRPRITFQATVQTAGALEPPPGLREVTPVTSEPAQRRSIQHPIAPPPSARFVPGHRPASARSCPGPDERDSDQSVTTPDTCATCPRLPSTVHFGGLFRMPFLNQGSWVRIPPGAPPSCLAIVAPRTARQVPRART